MNKQELKELISTHGAPVVVARKRSAGKPVLCVCRKAKREEINSYLIEVSLGANTLVAAQNLVVRTLLWPEATDPDTLDSLKALPSTFGRAGDQVLELSSAACAIEELDGEEVAVARHPRTGEVVAVCGGASYDAIKAYNAGADAAPENRLDIVDRLCAKARKRPDNEAEFNVVLHDLPGTSLQLKSLILDLSSADCTIEGN